MSEKLSWDVEIEATRVGMERLMRALVCTHSHFTDSFTLQSPRLIEKPSRASVFFRVWITVGAEQRFLALAQIARLHPPPVVQVGMESPREPLRSAIERLP